MRLPVIQSCGECRWCHETGVCMHDRAHHAERIGLNVSSDLSRITLRRVDGEERVVDDPEDRRVLGLSDRWAWEAGWRDRKGGDPSEWPESLRVREWPEVRRG